MSTCPICGRGYLFFSLNPVGTPFQQNTICQSCLVKSYGLKTEKKRKKEELMLMVENHF